MVLGIGGLYATNRSTRYNIRHRRARSSNSAAVSITISRQQALYATTTPEGTTKLRFLYPPNAPRRANCILGSTVPLPITYNYPSTGYLAPLGPAVQSLLPVLSSETGHQADFADSRVLESVSQVFPASWQQVKPNGQNCTLVPGWKTPWLVEDFKTRKCWLNVSSVHGC